MQDPLWHEMAALEAERRRLAQQVQGALTGQINLILDQLRAYERTAGADSRMAFAVLSSLMYQLLQRVYDLEASLDPATLETHGLVPALEALVGQQRRLTGAIVTLHLATLRERLPLHLERALYHTAQDAVIFAAAQHDAARVGFQLEHLPEGVRFSIATDGGAVCDDVAALEGRFALWGGTVALSQPHTLTIDLPLTPPVDLTEREMDVIRLLAGGLTNREIALRLAVRPRTVKFHLDNIYSKLGVSTRTEAAIYAVRQGWVSG